MTTKQRRNSSTKKENTASLFGQWEVFVKTEEYLKDRDKRLQREYGITLDTYEQMKKVQGGKCKICGDIPTGMRKKSGKPHSWNGRYYVDQLVVDHCHTTGRVRHLLCNRCNPLIGMGKEKRGRIMKAWDYIDKECGIYTSDAQV